MAKEDKEDLLKFLAPFSEEIQHRSLWLREFVWDLYPESNELIYDSYNAVAFGWGLSDKLGDVFCSVAVYGKGVNFGFNRGAELNDPEKTLLGNGNIYRYITVTREKQFPKTYIKKLLREAYVNALSRMKPAKTVHKGETIVKAIYEKKKRPA